MVRLLRFLVRRTLQKKMLELGGPHARAGVEIAEWLEAAIAFGRKPSKTTLEALHKEWMGVYNSSKPLLPTE